MNTQAIRAKRSRYARFLYGGAAVAMVVASAALVGVLPASAAATVNITSGPTPTSAVINQPISITVGVTGGSNGDTITITSGNCTIGGTDTGTLSGSSINFTNIKFTAVGTGCNLIATDTTATGASSPTGSVTVTATGPEAALAFTPNPPSTGTAGIALTTFKVSVEDAYGNVITSGTGSGDNISITSGCKFAGTSSATAVAGVATFSAFVLNQTGTCSLTAADLTDTALPTQPSGNTVTVSGGAATHLAFTVAPAASVLTTGTAIPSFAVSVEDVNGYVDSATTGSTDVITISSPCLAASVPVTAVAGVATFTTVAFATTGVCTLTATDTTRTLTPATATVSVGQAQTAITVTTKTGYLDAPLTLAATGGSGTGAVTFTVVNGTATGCAITSGTLKATKAGTCIVTATKAAVAPYTVGVSVATTVTISSAPKAVRLVGTVKRGKTTSVTVTGYNFSGRPKVTSNVAGFTGLVTKDSGKTVTIRITIKGTTATPGVKTLSLAFANGAHASVKYSLH